MSTDQTPTAPPVRDYHMEGTRHTLPPKHEYRSARCYSNGTPLPEGWEVRPVGERGYQAFRDDYGPLFTSSVRKDVESYVTQNSPAAPLSPRATADRARAAANLANGTQLPSGDTRYDTYSSGVPLPEGWVVRYHADRREYVGYRDNRCEARGANRAEVDRRIQFAVRTEGRKEWDEVYAVAAAEVAAVRQPEADRLAALMHRRERLWAVVGTVAGLIVGGTSVGLVAYNQAPETPVTSEYCLAAMGYADDLIAGYGDGLRGSMLSQPVDKAEALNAANDTVQRLTPLYEAEAMKCKVQR